MKLKITGIAVGCLLSIVFGCTDAERSALGSYGDAHVVELYSGGVMVKSWRSTGKVLTESQSDGYYFRDAETDKLVRVTGDLVIYPVSD